MQQELVEFDPDGEGIGCLFLVDEFAAGLGQGIELEFQVLVTVETRAKPIFMKRSLRKSSPNAVSQTLIGRRVL